MKPQQYFKSHPSRLEVFETTDGFLFPIETDAKNHQRLVDKDKPVKRHVNPAADVSPATETVEVVEKVIGSDEAGNIIGERSVKTAEVQKVELPDENDGANSADVTDKAADIAVQDDAGVKAADATTGKETIKEASGSGQANTVKAVKKAAVKKSQAAPKR